MKTKHVSKVLNYFGTHCFSLKKLVNLLQGKKYKFMFISCLELHVIGGFTLSLYDKYKSKAST